MTGTIEKQNWLGQLESRNNLQDETTGTLEQTECLEQSGWLGCLPHQYNCRSLPVAQRGDEQLTCSTNNQIWWIFFLFTARIHCCIKVISTNVLVQYKGSEAHSLLGRILPNTFRWRERKRNLCLFQDGGQNKKGKNIDHHCLRPEPNICCLPDPHSH